MKANHNKTSEYEASASTMVNIGMSKNESKSQLGYTLSKIINDYGKYRHVKE